MPQTIPADEQAIYDEYPDESWFPYYGPKGERGGSSGHYRAGGIGPIMPHVWRRASTFVIGWKGDEFACTKCGAVRGRRHA